MDIDIHNLQHAYLVLSLWHGDETVRSILDTLSLQKDHNPDLIVHEGPLGIDEARNISARVTTKPFGEKRILIIDASKVTQQAQNALLKTLEEPGRGNHFFLVAAYEDLLLPTLRSRLQKIDATKDIASSSDTSQTTFLTASPQKRLEFAKKFKDDGKPLGPFLDLLLTQLKDAHASLDTIENVFAMRRYADDQSSDSRLVLEHLALMLE